MKAILIIIAIIIITPVEYAMMFHTWHWMFNVEFGSQASQAIGIIVAFVSFLLLMYTVYRIDMYYNNMAIADANAKAVVEYDTVEYVSSSHLADVFKQWRVMLADTDRTVEDMRKILTELGTNVDIIRIDVATHKHNIASHAVNIDENYTLYKELHDKNTALNNDYANMHKQINELYKHYGDIRAALLDDVTVIKTS